jgi:hypothetical protein
MERHRSTGAGMGFCLFDTLAPAYVDISRLCDTTRRGFGLSSAGYCVCLKAVEMVVSARTYVAGFLRCSIGRSAGWRLKLPVE